MSNMGSGALGFAVILTGTWFIDSAIQDRPPIGSLKGILSQSPSQWGSAAKAADHTTAGSTSSGSATGGGATTGLTPPKLVKPSTTATAPTTRTPVVALSGSLPVETPRGGILQTILDGAK